MADTKITEKFSYKTNIITSFDGHEQRIKVRQYPRHLLSYDYSAMNAYEAQWVRGILRSKQDRFTYIPMWHRYGYLSENFIQNGKKLYLDMSYIYNFDGCDFIEIFVQDDINQTGLNIVRQVDHYDSDGIALKKKIDKPLNKKNTWIYPLKKVSVQPSDGLNYVYSNGTEVTLNFEDLLTPVTTPIPQRYLVNYDEDVKDYNHWNLPDNIDEREVLKLEPQWVDDDSNSLVVSKNSNRLDNESGIFIYDSKNKNSYDAHTVKIVLLNQKMINNLIRFFKRTGGMYKSFYMPTWVNDILPCKDLLVGTNYIYTEYNKLNTFYTDNSRKKKIVIFKQNGTSSIYDILMYTSETIDNVLYGKILLTKAMTDTVKLKDVNLISYMNLVRFDSDDLEINYETSTVATVTLVVKEVDDI